MEECVPRQVASAPELGKDVLVPACIGVRVPSFCPGAGFSASLCVDASCVSSLTSILCGHPTSHLPGAGFSASLCVNASSSVSNRDCISSRSSSFYYSPLQILPIISCARVILPRGQQRQVAEPQRLLQRGRALRGRVRSHLTSFGLLRPYTIAPLAVAGVRGLSAPRQARRRAADHCCHC